MLASDMIIAVVNAFAYNEIVSSRAISKAGLPVTAGKGLALELDKILQPASKYRVRYYIENLARHIQA